MADKYELYITFINVGEVYCMAHSKDGADKADFVWKALKQFPKHITEVSMAFIILFNTLESDSCIVYRY